ncbi:MAG: hypothetical protein A2186_03110 [Candidatus Levybacteria bacterium RIFOXYA1_FULL_41_10]|nr:MAG: hypothetical protein UT44_C0024G0003 [Candidatus Levybacteria bacterium GW2011_GWA1_39_32]KKR50289.1 MAG: hypothetical protein UT87_C0018G0007 [Candidatus Levybacteria bacterium GW2011_GWC1_40_19]KKR94770.1 MAG: hypothetical protein UU45_C0007G0018 [Candidatus Levybacteria bacterium GW2011_GWA2_41_15]OGH21166.1 MAG: hypothetical protein A2695_00895 [Candidatus Levybacteria bacterium RIFCSPHIGHO2_01_FULL_40_83]OGH27416.1 MAG: hypothetical protein A3D82_01840 [Candidatus Levybacteria bact
MKKYFYSHIVETSSISLTLSEIDMTNEERAHLSKLAESHLHHAILNTVLSELSEDDKKIFLTHLSEDDHDKIWALLKEKISDIEGKIKNAGEMLKKELHKDIEDSKKE